MTIEEIKQSQIDNKISDKELCAMANISDEVKISISTFWRYSTGKTGITLSKLNRLESALAEILEERAK